MIKASPEKVFRAFTEPLALAGSLPPLLLEYLEILSVKLLPDHL
jgi:hypothetical protein